MTLLPDGSVLIAVADHVHHNVGRSVARNIVRHLRRSAAGAIGRAPATWLRGLVSHRAHEFWPDDLEYGDVSLAGVMGHRQVTDAYLAALAARRAGMLVTFDRGLAALHSDVAALLPSQGG